MKQRASLLVGEAGGAAAGWEGHSRASGNPEFSS